MSHGGKAGHGATKKLQPWEVKEDGPTNNMSVYKEDLFNDLLAVAKEAAKEKEKEKPRPAAVLDPPCSPVFYLRSNIHTCCLCVMIYRTPGGLNGS
jgi:hypothetical protein